jgi:hypothetical protein
MPLVKFRTKIRLFSFDFRQNFEVRTFSGERISSLAEHTRNRFHRWLSIRRNI